MKLMVNDIIKNTSANTSFRILQIYSDNDTIIIIEMESPYKLPQIECLSDIKEGFDSNYYTLYQANESITDINTLTNKQINNLNYIWNLIKPIVTDDKIAYDWKRRRTAINEIVNNNKCSHSTVQRWLHKYWAGGSVKSALVSEYRKRGGFGKVHYSSDNTIGRPYKYEHDKSHANIGELEKKRIKKIIDKTYNRNTKYKIPDSYALFIKKYYWDDTKNEIIKPYPTIWQFRYHAQKILNLRKRIGEKKFDRNYRAILKNSSLEADGPGEKYQIDATIADVYLVSRFDRDAIIGRPVLYFVTDVFSRMITGFYVSLEGPSWIDAMMALYYTNMDKSDLCKQFGVDISSEDWPCSGLPQILLTDNGELVSNASNQIVSELGIHMQNASAWRPDMKAIVEQSFHLFNGKVRMLLPGAIQPDYKERGAKDYKLDATLNLLEFNKIIINYILKYNNHVLSKAPQNSEDIIQAQVSSIPIDIWNWGVLNRSGCLSKRTSIEVAYSLLPNDSARITEKGIKYNSLYYTCPSFIRDDLGSEVRINGTRKIQIKHDPRNTNNIILCKDGKFELCTRIDSDCNDWFEEDLTFKTQTYNAKTNYNNDHNLKNEVIFKTNVDDIIDNAINEKKHTKKVIELPKKNRIRENRSSELSIQRNEETFLKSDSQIKKDIDPQQTKTSKEKYSSEILKWQKEKDDK